MCPNPKTVEGMRDNGEQRFLINNSKAGRDSRAPTIVFGICFALLSIASDFRLG